MRTIDTFSTYLGRSREEAMKNTIITLTLLLVAALFVSGVYYPESQLMWFAASTTEFAYLRGAVFVVLLGLLFTSPPRGFHFRALLMGLAILLGTVTISQTLMFEMNLLDTLVFSEVMILLAVESLELAPAAHPAKKIVVKTV